MSKIAIGLIVACSLLAGFGGGWVYELTLGKEEAATTTTTTAATVVDSAATTAKTQTLEDCKKEAWGEDKYAAFSVNADLATTEDNLAILKCYK